MVLDNQNESNYIVITYGVQFEWDTRKNAINHKKHGVAFEEAVTIFFDKQYLEIADPDHSMNEDRFIAIGISNRLRLLVVCHSILGEDEIYRIISARVATKKEEQQYGRKTNAKRI